MADLRAQRSRPMLALHLCAREAEKVNEQTKKITAIVGVIAMLGGLTLAIASRTSAHVDSALEGTQAPNFSLPTITADPQISGKQLRLQDFAEKPLLLHFWAPSCAPCVQELPKWQRLAQDSEKSGDFSVLTVAGDGSLEVQRFLAKNHYTFPTVYDANGKVHLAYGVTGIPFTYAISAKAVIVRALAGVQSEADLREALGAAR